jgi:hypothetical protein
MAKSKTRGGEKSHRKRVELRNASVKAQMKRKQEMFSKIMEETIKKMKEEQEMSGDTSTSQSVKLNTDGFVQSAEIL